MEQLKERELLPGFRLRSVRGELISPSDYRGKKDLVIILHDPSYENCERFIGEAAARYEDYKATNAEILVVGSASEGELTSLVQRLGLRFPVLIDPEAVVQCEYADGEPVVIVTDRYGEIQMISSLTETAPDHDKIIGRVELNELECPECGVATWPV